MNKSIKRIKEVTMDNNKKDGLQLAIEIIEKERLIAIDINPVMALGMKQVKELIEQELEKC